MHRDDRVYCARTRCPRGLEQCRSGVEGWGLLPIYTAGSNLAAVLPEPIKTTRHIPHQQSTVAHLHAHVWCGKQKLAVDAFYQCWAISYLLFWKHSTGGKSLFCSVLHPRSHQERHVCSFIRKEIQFLRASTAERRHSARETMIMMPSGGNRS